MVIVHVESNKIKRERMIMEIDLFLFEMKLLNNISNENAHDLKTSYLDNQSLILQWNVGDSGQQIIFPLSSPLTDLVFLNCENRIIIKLPTFPNLRTLICDNNELTDLPKFPELEILRCSNNKLREIGIYKKLVELNCTNNIITEIDFTHFPVLQILFCSKNNIQEFEPHPKLFELVCNDNKLTRIEGFPNLELLSCGNNNINYIEKSSILRSIYAPNNILENFNINHFKKLTGLDIVNNGVRKLAFHAFLEELFCSKNPIKKIPQYPHLESLDINDTLVAKLPQFPYLRFLRCLNTPMTRINHYPYLEELICDMNKIESMGRTDFFPRNIKSEELKQIMRDKMDPEDEI